MQENIKQIANLLSHHHIKSYYVGGCVRDELMDEDTDDYDICLVGVTNPRIVEDILLEHSESVTPLVGQKFPVWIATINGRKVDFALARKETLVGGTRKDFDVVTEDVTIEEDLRRRDFTINAIAKEVIHGEYVDPFNGIKDIEDKVLRHTSEAFGEDTLRVYRAARFLARFPDFTPHVQLGLFCSGLKPFDISNERVGIELRKMIEKAKKPSRFFEFLRSVGWLGHHFKEVQDTIHIPQNPKHHPEGDVFNHTMHSMDAATDWFTRICMLCHDLGKVTTTTVYGVDFRDLKTGDSYSLEAIKSIGHERAGTEPTRDMLTRISFADRKTIRQIETMVELHMIRIGVSEKVVRRTLRRLMEKHLQYDQLVEVCRCDLSGRPPLAGYTPDIGQNRAKQLLEEDAMTPIVTGEKLLEVGYAPGKHMGQLVTKALEWQDRGTLNRDNWLKMIKQYKHDTKTVQKTA